MPQFAHFNKPRPPYAGAHRKLPPFKGKARTRGRQHLRAARPLKPGMRSRYPRGRK